MNEDTPFIDGGPSKRHLELRLGQIYQERGKRPPRYVQVMKLHDDKTVTLQRVGPANPRVIGRRSVRKAKSLLANFDFVYEEIVSSVCTRCGKKILTRHYPEKTHSEFCKGGVCWDCFEGGRKK